MNTDVIALAIAGIGALSTLWNLLSGYLPVLRGLLQLTITKTEKGLELDLFNRSQKKIKMYGVFIARMES